MAHWHDFNPWASTIVYIPSLEELAECVAGGTVSTQSGIKPYTVEYVVASWRRAGKKLDAYILPQPEGKHSIGVRYGAEGSQYLSPYNANNEKAIELLRKYGGQK